MEQGGGAKRRPFLSSLILMMKDETRRGKGEARSVAPFLFSLILMMKDEARQDA